MSSTAGMIIKTFAPTIRKLAEGGKIDGFFRSIKEEHAKNLNLNEGETVEIMITTEDDGREYVSLVVFSGGVVSQIVTSMPLSEMVIKLLEQI